MVDTVRGLRIGPKQLGAGATPAFQTYSVDATNDGVGFVFQARDTNPITHLGFRYTLRTGTPPTQVATIEGVSTTTGLPDGTDVGGGSPTAATFTPPASTAWDATFQWIALTNAFTPTLGAWYAGTLRYSSGTIDASNFSSYATHVTNFGFGGQSLPYAVRLTAGAWSKQGNPPVFGVRTASSRYGLPIQGFYNTRSASTVGYRQAMKIRVPSGLGTYKVGAVTFAGSIANAASKVPIVGVWSSSGAIHTTVVDTEQVVNQTTTYNGYEVVIDESLAALDSGTDYYFGLEVADAAGAGVLINGMQLASADDRDAFDGGSNVCFSTYNGSSWTDDVTVVPFVNATLYDLTPPSSGGGGAFVLGGLSQTGMGVF